MSLRSEFEDHPKQVIGKLALVAAVYVAVVALAVFGPTVPLLRKTLTQVDLRLLRMYCCTALSTSICAWIVWLVPQMFHTAIVTVVLCIAASLAWSGPDQLFWSFPAVSSAATVLMTFASRLAGMSVLSSAQLPDNQRFQFSVRTILIALTIAGAFFATGQLMTMISATAGWSFCNAILFSLCFAGTTAGLFLAVLKPKHFLTSLLLGPIVFVAFTSLALHWLPDEEFPDKWSADSWLLIGRQTLMHAAMVFVPLIVVRLLGYRVGTVDKV